jgi:hypothetical protein
MGLLPATLGIGSNWTRWRLLRHLLPLYPAPAAWRLSQLAPRITKSDEEPVNFGEGCNRTAPAPFNWAAGALFSNQ